MSGRKSLVKAVIVMGTFILCTLAMSAAAQAEDILDGNIRNEQTGRCLDHFEGNPITDTCHNQSSQLWWLHRWRDNTWELKHHNTGWCLDDSFEEGFRSYYCNRTRWQSWYIRTWRDGTKEYRNQATGRCLDDNWVDGLHVRPCNRLTWQSWW
jgi:hypothetical protein